jgi:hypothetical protein
VNCPNILLEEKQFLIDKDYDNYDALKYYNEFEKNCEFTICCMCAIENNNMISKKNVNDNNDKKEKRSY